VGQQINPSKGSHSTEWLLFLFVSVFEQQIYCISMKMQGNFRFDAVLNSNFFPKLFSILIFRNFFLIFTKNLNLPAYE